VKRGLAILGALLVAAQAQAQFGGGPLGRGGGDGSSGRGRHGRPAEAGTPDRPAAQGQNYLMDQLQRQLAEAHDKLKLRPDQEALWDAYAEKTVALMADQLRAPPETPKDQVQSATAQIERRVDVVRNRLAAMEEIADAAKRLYAKLDPGQRTQADQWLPPTVPELYSSLWQGSSGGRPGPGGRGGPGGPPSGGGPPPAQ